MSRPLRRQVHPAALSQLVGIRDEHITVSAYLWGGRPHQAVALTAADAYVLGRDLVDAAQALQAGVPWRWHDPQQPDKIAQAAALVGLTLDEVAQQAAAESVRPTE